MAQRAQMQLAELQEVGPQERLKKTAPESRA
jgi:hypothetical protein